MAPMRMKIFVCSHNLFCSWCMKFNTIHIITFISITTIIYIQLYIQQQTSDSLSPSVSSSSLPDLSMAWRCSSTSHQGLINNLFKANIIKSERVQQIMNKVDRAYFSPRRSDNSLDLRDSYDDRPLSIGYGATISAPHMHAMCLELLNENLKPGSRALDVGSGSGYLVACFGEMVGSEGKSVGIEHMGELVEFSKRNLNEFYKNKIPTQIIVMQGDGLV